MCNVQSLYSHSSSLCNLWLSNIIPPTVQPCHCGLPSHSLIIVNDAELLLEFLYKILVRAFSTDSLKRQDWLLQPVTFFSQQTRLAKRTAIFNSDHPSLVMCVTTHYLLLKVFNLLSAWVTLTYGRFLPTFWENLKSFGLLDFKSLGTFVMV